MIRTVARSVLAVHEIFLPSLVCRIVGHRRHTFMASGQTFCLRCKEEM